MLLSDLLDIDKMDGLIINGYISARQHPSLPLTIYNYSKKTQWERNWTVETEWCRGLIVDDDNRVIALPFKKFFNYGEVELNTSGPVEVTDKIDGSLIVCALYEDQLVTATRGSFTSEQAIFAQKILDENYSCDAFNLLKNAQTSATLLFECVYPENRIVIDYGNTRDLFLLGFQSDGIWISANKINWPGPKVEHFSCDTFEEALALAPRKNAEGIVVYFKDSGERLKIKQSDYIELHKLVSDLTPRRLWENLKNNTPAEDFLSALPDEFYEYAFDIVCKLLGEWSELKYKLYGQFTRIIGKLGPDFNRKDFALACSNVAHKSAMFLFLDGKDSSVAEYAWQQVKPKYEEPKWQAN